MVRLLYGAPFLQFCMVDGGRVQCFKMMFKAREGECRQSGSGISFATSPGRVRCGVS